VWNTKKLIDNKNGVYAQNDRPVPMVFVDDVDETPVDAKIYLKTDSRSNRIYD